MKSEELKAIMDNYYCTDNYYKMPLLSITYTDGVKAFIENAGAYWFVTDVAIFRKEAIKKNRDEYMFSVHLIVKDGKADMLFKDGDGHICYKHHYAFTDCPDGDWVFYYYVEENLLIWNGEY